MFPSNVPASEPRRLLRRSTGRATPSFDRKLMTLEERNRIREREMAQRQTSDSVIIAANNSGLRPGEPGYVPLKLNGGDTSFGSNFSVLHPTHVGTRTSVVRTGSSPAVKVFDTLRTQWLDPLHRSERRNAHQSNNAWAGGFASEATKDDLKYVPAQDMYVGTEKLAVASKTSYTDSERLAFANFQKSQTLMLGTGGSDSNNFSSSVSRQRTSPNRSKFEGPLSPMQRSASVPPPSHSANNNNNHLQGSFAQIYHERLNHLKNSVDNSGSSFATSELQKTENKLNHHIADATKNYFGVRHAPSATQAKIQIQASRDAASSIIHGDVTNSAGHHKNNFFGAVPVETSEKDIRKKTRAVIWKQERFDRDDFIINRREDVAARQEAIENAKHERAMSRSLDFERNTEKFWKRDSGAKLVKDCPVRSEKTTIGNWLFAYPVKEEARK